MPSSTYRTISYICERISKLEFKSVLDIGVGFGKYGFLVREYAGGFPLPTEEKELLLVDGIEIYEPYIQPIHKLLYDSLYIGDATKLIKNVDIYDLILCIDVLEHVLKETGLLFLKDIKQHSKIALVALPRSPAVQEGLFGNVHEAHISSWCMEELAQFGQVVGLAQGAFVLEMKEF